MTEKNVALIYVRKSQTLDKVDENSVERQVANSVRICEENTWQYKLFMDVSKPNSGVSNLGRPAWLALNQRLDDLDVVAVVANDPSRLYRKTWRMAVWIEELNERGIQLLFASSNNLSDFLIVGE